VPRFVVLEHDHPVLHWDLMLEHDGQLRTWRLLREPVGDDHVPAEPLPAHRLAYLDHEGPVSGDRGTVTRWDAGTYEVVDTDEVVETGVDGPTFVLVGRRLVGRFAFVTWDGTLYLRTLPVPIA
jgi:hypothetical protein